MRPHCGWRAAKTGVLVLAEAFSAPELLRTLGESGTFALTLPG
ncbi:hypothetical protein [Streptomyces tauricus]